LRHARYLTTIEGNRQEDLGKAGKVSAADERRPINKQVFRYGPSYKGLPAVSLPVGDI